MSGTIAVTPEMRWSVAGWLFDWTVGFLARNVGDAQLAADLDEVINENIGWLGLGDFGPEAERVMRDLLRDKVVAEATVTLPGTLTDRTAVLQLLQELADGVGRTTV